MQGTEQALQNNPMAYGPMALPMLIGQAIRERAGIPSADETVRDVDALKKRGMAYRGDGEFDAAGLAGAVMSPAGLGAGKILPRAATAGKRILQGTAVGAGFGAATPVTEEGDFGTAKLKQTGLGAAVGAAIPSGFELAKAGGRAVRDTLDLILPGGAQRVANRFQASLVGEGNRNKVADALAQARELVPGAKPTAAEAVAHLPEGSPIIAQQKITAAQPGGVSAQFGQRTLDQKSAIERAIEARNAATTPMRESALEAANAGGVKSDAVTSGIDATLGKPGLRASDVVQSTLSDVKEKIAKFTNDQGAIDANDLYTIRKEIGNTIKKYAAEKQNWDKKLTAGLERDIQKAMDEAIESAGGAGWKQYLAEFAERSKGIEGHAARLKMVAKPAQRTNVGGGLNVAEETRAHIPNLLSRPAMVVNAVLKAAAGKKFGIEPRVDEIMADQYLNPQKLADALRTAGPAERSAIVKALMQFRQAPIVAGATAAGATQ